VSSVAIRIVVVVGALLLVLLLARLAGKWQRPSHPAVEVSALGSEAGIVLFTSTDCSNCAAARRVAEASGLPIREVTWELEPGRFSAAGVEAVPLTVLVDDRRAATAVFAGVPSGRAIQRAARRAGITASR
jgi:hypothetical protein